MISISCLESKLLNNNNWYGRFQLAPFQKGEGLTVANALRRTLLAEKSNFFITWVDFYNAEIPYSVLTGMRESIFDILLNLKQVIFTSDQILPIKKHTNLGDSKPKASKKKNWSNQNNSYKILKNFTNSLFLVNNQKNMLKSSFNESSNRFLSMTKQNRINKALNDECFKTQNLFYQTDYRAGTSSFFLSEKKNRRVPSKHKSFQDAQTLPIGLLQSSLQQKKQNGLKRWGNSQNQILGKIINSEDKTPYLIPLKIFTRDIDLSGKFWNTLKKTANSTYIGYICVRGPTTIYAKNIKLPKGLKCVDPNKYIATLADDGLFYLRFALTTEIKPLPLNNISNRSINVNQGLKFNQVKLKTRPKIIFNKEIQSNFDSKADLHILKQKESKKPNQKFLDNSRIDFFGSHPTPIHYTKNLINEQRLLLTNDSIKQFNFQNTSIIASIQKTCLLNLQIKHYYYKCGRFDRFLFDLIKPFKPNLKSTYKTSLKNVFDQNNNWNVLTYFQRIFERQKCNSQLLIASQIPTPVSIYAKPLGCLGPLVTQANNLKKPFINKLFNGSSSENTINNPSVNVLTGEITHSFSFRQQFQNSKLNVFKRYLSSHEKPSKNRYISSSFGKWQKTFKFLRTSSLYDYLQKLQINEAILIGFLFTKLRLESGVSFLDSNLIAKINSKTKPLTITLASVFKASFNTNMFFPDYLWPGENIKKEELQRNLKEIKTMDFPLHKVTMSENASSKQELTGLGIDNENEYNDFWMSQLNPSYLKKFVNRCVSFDSSKNHILYLLKFYAWKRNNLSDFLNKNPICKENILHCLGLKTNSIYCEKSFTKIDFLRQWFFSSNENKKIKLINQPYLFSGRTEKENQFFFYSPPSQKSLNILEAQVLRGPLNSAHLFPSSILTSIPDKIPRTMEESSNKYKSISAVRMSVNLRTKPFISIQSISYKPIWIVPYQFKQNKNKLVSSLYNINLRNNLEQTQINKKSFLNFSYLTRKNRKTRFNAITTNSVVFKPTYLSVEQIIYILKQTTRFCKNQRINPVFFDSLNCPACDPPINKNNDYPLNDSFIFPKVYNSFSNFLFKPFFLQNFKQIICFDFRYNKIWISKNYILKPTFCYVGILANNFLFKNNFSYTILKNQSYWPSKDGSLFKQTVNKDTNQNNQRSHIQKNFNYFPVLSMDYKAGQLFSSSLLAQKLPNFLEAQMLRGNSGFACQFPSSFLHSTEDKILKTMGECSNIQNFYSEPYNINSYHSKIAFSLRYTYPFKYTVFETVLPFVYFSEKKAGLKFDNSMQNYDFFSLVKNKNFKEKTHKNYQVTNKMKDIRIRVFNPKTICSYNLDGIQYNQSFKIYTTLAYPCLKTYEAHLSKYHNFNRLNQKKSKTVFLQRDTLFKTVLNETQSSRKYDSSLIKVNNGPTPKDISFESSMNNLVSFQNNHQNWIFNINSRKSNHEKFNIYPFLTINDQLPTRFNSVSKWRIMNNPNFNDAFIIIPYTWSLNSQLDKLSNLIKPIYSFKTSLQKLFYLKYISQNTNNTIFFNSFNKKKEIVKNQLYWCKTTNTNRELKCLRPSLEKNFNKAPGTEASTYRFKKSSFLIPKFKIKKSLKKLAISFENVYYKNFLWNSQKITLRVLNNAILPLVANRKYTISSFIPFYNNSDKLSDSQKSPFYSVRHKNLGTTNFMCYKTRPEFLNDHQNKMFKPNFVNGIPQASIFNNKLSNTEAKGFLWNENERKKQSLKTSNQKTRALSNSLQKNEERLPYLTNELQTQRSDYFFESSFLSLRSKWRPFFSGSLKYFQEKDFSFQVPFVDFTTQALPVSFLESSLEQTRQNPLEQWGNAQNEKLNENSKNQLLSLNQIIRSPVLIQDSFRPEKLIALRKNRWIKELIQGSILSNLEEEDISQNDSNIKSPLVSNLWLSSFFSSYSLYAISSKSDVFLQNLISNNDHMTSQTNDMEIFRTNSTVDEKNLKEKPFSYNQNNLDKILNAQSYSKSYDKTIQNVLKFQNNNSTKRFVIYYNYNWQKAVRFTILNRFKTSKFNVKKKKVRFNWYKNQLNDPFFLQYPKKNVDYASQNFYNRLTNKYRIRRLKIYERYFGNPLRRRISQNRIDSYNLILPIKLYKKFTTPSSQKAKRHIIKSWKSIICTCETDTYFNFGYPLFIQNCNLPWQKSKHIFDIPKHWFNRITEYSQSSLKLTHHHFLKTKDVNRALNPSLFIIYTQLSSSSNKTHQSLLANKPFPSISITSQVDTHIQNKGSYKIISYFTIKESLNSIYKVNYIVESQIFESDLVSHFPQAEAIGKSFKSISELAFHFNENNRITTSSNSIEELYSRKKFDNVQRDSLVTDSLTVSNFLNGTYSFIPNKAIISSSFNKLIDSPINKSKTENENEYIQIDIWTNGELSPRKALLNAFLKLFELFYNLSKYNCLKPIEI